MAYGKQPARSGAKRLQKWFARRVTIEWLPAYAPELNPVEQVWNRTKYVDLPNYIPEDAKALGQKVRRCLGHQRKQASLLRPYLKHAKLNL